MCASLLHWKMSNSDRHIILMVLLDRSTLLIKMMELSLYWPTRILYERSAIKCQTIKIVLNIDPIALKLVWNINEMHPNSEHTFEVAWLRAKYFANHLPKLIVRTFDAFYNALAYLILRFFAPLSSVQSVNSLIIVKRMTRRNLKCVFVSLLSLRLLN